MPSSVPLLINTERRCGALVRCLYAPTRKTPVLVVTQSLDRSGPVIPAPHLQEVLGPLARVFTLSGGALKPFNRLLDHVYGIEPSGVRMYLPRMTINDYPARHPVWNQFRIDEFPTRESFIEMLRDICQKRLSYQKTHKHTAHLLSPEEADALLHQMTPALRAEKTPRPTKYITHGRKVLTVSPPKPSEEALVALCQKFQRA